MKILVNNKRANFKYEIIKNFEAGIALTGSEVKSLSLSHGNIDEAFIVIKKNEIFILNMSIPKYKFNTLKNHDERRTRKLLMHKHEIVKIALEKKQEKLTIVPIIIYWSRGKIKVRISLVRGKKKHDKRDTIKKRDQLRELKRDFNI